MTDPARPPATRKADTLARLTKDVDAWISTANEDGSPYLMPLSFLWNGETLLISTARKNPTSRNLLRTGQVHLSLDGTRDVILITGTAEQAHPTDQEAEAFATKAGFDPRQSNYPYFKITPLTIQAWREVNELQARNLMKDGTWLV
ncbi:pyridoxamine 5'-phosphate oxidase [Kribbella amoyensis]|uniref:Pyridoxamine 5'-phosphate oxidase n=1 Tax=Kribbella amoyensis TaxID=996641 RepID=A0A561BZL6_9ACTN|nr:pyridoxamine 5'-phosphate oxidase family protein [Kribbella amoyensis]TWD84323.1 pyridoxamine 5'-phosphate oxidase [Kribbella amoyensis]